MSFSAYALVRDKNGNPRFDSLDNIEEGYWKLLTENEKQSIINYRKTGELKWL